MTHLCESHQARARDAEHVVHQQATFPPEPVRHPAPAKAAEHTADGEDRHGHRVQLLDELLADVLAVPVLVHVLHKVLDVDLGRVDDAGVVPELQHPEDGREDRVRQEERQTLNWQTSHFEHPLEGLKDSAAPADVDLVRPILSCFNENKILCRL